MRILNAIDRLILWFHNAAIDFAYPPDNVADDDEPKSAVEELHHVFFVS
jgi:hypothetical protein